MSVPGKAAHTANGEAFTDAALTHIDITGSSLSDILAIVRRIQKGSNDFDRCAVGRTAPISLF